MISENVSQWYTLNVTISAHIGLYIYIFLDEESSTIVINELLSLRKVDAALIELEDMSRDALLEKVFFIWLINLSFKNMKLMYV